jgi:hypothetical protein
LSVEIIISCKSSIDAEQKLICGFHFICQS